MPHSATVFGQRVPALLSIRSKLSSISGAFGAQLGKSGGIFAVSVDTDLGRVTTVVQLNVIDGQTNSLVLGQDWYESCVQWFRMRKFDLNELPKPDEISTRGLPGSESGYDFEDFIKRVIPPTGVDSSVTEGSSRPTGEMGMYAGAMELPEDSRRHLVSQNGTGIDGTGAAGYWEAVNAIMSNNVPRNSNIYTSSRKRLGRILFLHGIDDDGLSKKEMRSSIIYHFMNGMCAGGGSSSCRGVCEDLNQIELAYFVSTAVQGGLSIGEIVADEVYESICDALGISVYGKVSSVASRTAAMRSLANRAGRIKINGVGIKDAVENRMQTMPLVDVMMLAAAHGYPFMSGDAVIFRNKLSEHFAAGDCVHERYIGCTRSMSYTYDDCEHNTEVEDRRNDVKLCFLEESLRMRRISVGSLRKIGECLGVEGIDENSTVRDAKKALKRYAATVRKGKNLPAGHDKRLRDMWPQVVPRSLKERMKQLFREETSSDRLREVVCAGCSEAIFANDCHSVPVVDDTDISCLRAPGTFLVDGERYEWDTSGTCCPKLPTFADERLNGLMIDPKGVHITDAKTWMDMCRRCQLGFMKKKMPGHALVNDNYLGDIPQELTGLTLAEEMCISLCRPHVTIVKLKEEQRGIDPLGSQRGFRGNIIIHPQKPEFVHKLLPPSLEDVASPICVVFVGSKKPSRDWLRKKAWPLCVRGDVIRRALLWLKRHNKLYKDVDIDETRMKNLPEYDVLPVHVEHVQSNRADTELTSRYDDPSANGGEEAVESAVREEEVLFQNVVIPDVDTDANEFELRSAAWKHMKRNGGQWIEIPTGRDPESEFNNPGLFPKMYPTLYPYGIGGFEDKSRRSSFYLKGHAKHLFTLSDRRFQEHHSMMFTVFNILQRRAVLWQTGMKTKYGKYKRAVADYTLVSASAVHRVAERVAKGDTKTAYDAEEKRALRLMREVNIINMKVPGSGSSRLAMRNEIRALMIEHGCPNFYLTINPADVYSPILKFLAGHEIDVDNLLPEQIPKYKEQSVLVAKNPVVAAKFFHLVMSAFIKCLLGFDAKGRNKEGGVLGNVKAHYGCVEAQGRGTLHCHMVVWLEGGMNPNQLKDKILKDDEVEFRRRLIEYLEDVMGSGYLDLQVVDDDVRVPSTMRSQSGKRVNPSSVRGPVVKGLSEDLAQDLRKKDLALLVENSQRHRHGPSCYKYGDNMCRYDLDECHRRLESTIDMETGEVCVRCLDGLINSYNETILEAMRCNMDIKFIGSGASAKAILFYITDYISKSQLKAHVAYAALDVAIQKISQVSMTETKTAADMARTVLRKCANALLARQELSGQQVGSYLTDVPDHYTSHQYKLFFWSQFEGYIEAQMPSAECNVAEGDLSGHDENEDEIIEDNEEGIGANTVGDRSNEEVENVRPHFNDNVPVRNVDDEAVLRVVEGDQLELASSQLEDYVHRGTGLRNLCLWDFVGRYQKVVKKNKKSNGRSDYKEADNMSDASGDFDVDMDDLDHLMDDICNEDMNLQQDTNYESEDGFVVPDEGDDNELVSPTGRVVHEGEFLNDSGHFMEGLHETDLLDDGGREADVNMTALSNERLDEQIRDSDVQIRGEGFIPRVDDEIEGRVYFGDPVALRSDVEEDQLNLDAQIMSKSTEKNPRSILDKGHPLYNKYYLRLRGEDKRLVVVPVGGSIPRRDQLRTFARYCRAMLVFFMPWVTARDLRTVDETWEAAYERFVKSEYCSARVIELMENMQILHECKDSRDDHLRNRRRIFKRSFVGSERIIQREMYFLDDEDQEEILEHIEACKKTRSNRAARLEDNKESVLKSIQINALFADASMSTGDRERQEHRYMDVDAIENVAVSTSGDKMEKDWRAEFQQRRERVKKAAKAVNIIGDDEEGDNERDLLPSIGGLPALPVGVDERFTHNTVPRTNQIDESSADVPMDIDEFVKKWNLNNEQALAFRIVAEHSMGLDPKPLRMHLSGAAGTGKTRVLNALKDFFAARKEARRFRIAAYMGVAARNVGGMTLHGALNMQANAEDGNRGERDLQAMWDGVDYLFVDEISMIGCRFLTAMSDRLMKAKNKDKPFGNISVIFAGDFAQLGAVLDQKLYTDHRRTGIKARASGGANEKAACRRLLWLSVDIVVQLTEVKRQSGDDAFVKLLNRLRTGACTDRDVQLLNTRVLGRDGIHVDMFADDPVPIIVSDNVTKDAINEYAAIQYAERTGQILNWYYSEDLYGNAPITEEHLRERLHSMHSGQTSHRLGRIPLVLGMPVMISQNFDVEGGVANGARGKIKKIRFREDDEGRRYLTSCVVELDGEAPNVEPMPWIENSRNVPVLREGHDISFDHPHSGRKIKIRRLQVPISPAFAITAYKSQGLTMAKVILDFGAVQGCEEPYVMLSRATGLQGLFLLRPVTKEAVTKQPSEDRRLESGRLRLLAIKTKEQYGNSDEKEYARRVLSKLQGDRLDRVDFTREERMILEGRAYQTTDSASTGKKSMYAPISLMAYIERVVGKRRNDTSERAGNSSMERNVRKSRRVR